MPVVHIQKNTLTLKAIILCALLTTNSTKPMAVDNAAGVQSYALVCLASLGIGAAIYALAYTYCSSQPTIILKQSPLEEEALNNNFFKPLQTTTGKIEDDQKKIIELLEEQQKTITDLHTKLIATQTQLNALTTTTKKAKGKTSKLLTHIDTFYETNNSIIPLYLTLYWAHKSEKQRQELENKTQDLNVCSTQSLGKEIYLIKNEEKL